MNALLPDREENCTYDNILNDYKGLKEEIKEVPDPHLEKLTGAIWIE